MQRVVYIVNFDLVVENFDYFVFVDIREFIFLDDVMEEFGLGLNGVLIYCMEEFEDNMDDWLNEKLDDFMDDDYLVFDCFG